MQWMRAWIYFVFITLQFTLNWPSCHCPLTTNYCYCVNYHGVTWVFDSYIIPLGWYLGRYCGAEIPMFISHHSRLTALKSLASWRVTVSRSGVSLTVIALTAALVQPADSRQFCDHFECDMTSCVAGPTGFSRLPTGGLQ